MGMELPPDAKVPEQMPEALYWLLQTEEWGLPLAGGHLEQPWHFMQDLEAANLGRARVKEIRAANAKMQVQRKRETQYGQNPDWTNRLRLPR